MTHSNVITPITRLALLALCLQLAACENVQAMLDGVAETRRPLAYFAWLESADQDALDREQARLSAPSDNHNPRITLVQRALLYSVPPGANNDSHGDARELLMVALQETETDASPSSLQEEYTAFARIWLALLEQKHQYQSAQANQLSDQDRIRELSVKVDRLEKQIEALTTIEQRLIEREQTQGQTK